MRRTAAALLLVLAVPPLPLGGAAAWAGDPGDGLPGGADGPLGEAALARLLAPPVLQGGPLAAADVEERQRLEVRERQRVGLDHATVVRALALGDTATLRLGDVADLERDLDVRDKTRREVDLGRSEAAAAIAFREASWPGLGFGDVVDASWDITLRVRCKQEARLDKGTATAAIALGPALGGMPATRTLTDLDRRCTVERTLSQDVDADPKTVVRALAVAGDAEAHGRPRGGGAGRDAPVERGRAPPPDDGEEGRGRWAEDRGDAPVASRRGGDPALAEAAEGNEPDPAAVPARRADPNPWAPLGPWRSVGDGGPPGADWVAVPRGPGP